MPSHFAPNSAEAYEASMGRWSRRLATPFLEFAGVPSRGRVLDAGCGTGSLTLALSTHPELEAIEALDFEENFVAALKGRTSDIRIKARQGDVCALPYENGTFDGVYSLLVLHFVSDPDRAVREMRRVLRPGATAAAAVWAWGGVPSWRMFWDVVLATEPEAAEHGVPTARRPLTEEGELRPVFEAAGFAGLVETKITIGMDFTSFDDFWHPTVYGQGTFAAFFDALPEERRVRLRDTVKAAYLAGGPDGPRGFPSFAWAVRGHA